MKSPLIDKDIANQINPQKTPHILEDKISYEDKSPAWSFKRMQKESMWLFTREDLINSTQNSLDSTCILSKLAEFERMTWRQIKQQTHGKRGKSSNHLVPVEELTKVAKKRLQELQITENFFSLRLEGTMRVFGVLESNVLEIMWYDPEHKIYPLDK